MKPRHRRLPDNCKPRHAGSRQSLLASYGTPPQPGSIGSDNPPTTLWLCFVISRPGIRAPAQLLDRGVSHVLGNVLSGPIAKANPASPACVSDSVTGDLDRARVDVRSKGGGWLKGHSPTRRLARGPTRHALSVCAAVILSLLAHKLLSLIHFAKSLTLQTHLRNAMVRPHS